MQGDKKGAYESIGSHNYRCPKNECATEEGHERYLDYTICGDNHFQLTNFKKHIRIYFTLTKACMCILQKWKKKEKSGWEHCFQKRRSDVYGLYGYMEWIGLTNDTLLKFPHGNWERNTIEDHTSKDPLENFTIESVWQYAKEKVMIKPTFCIMDEMNKQVSNNKYDEILLKIYPLLISTDGGLDVKIGNHALAAIAWSILDIRDKENMTKGEWQNRQKIPLLARISRLPEKIGSHKVDIGHGELLAYCIQEERLGGAIARIVVRVQVHDLCSFLY